MESTKVSPIKVFCLDGEPLHLESVGSFRPTTYDEYHKREVTLLRFFFQLFNATDLDLPFPYQFQIRRFTAIKLSGYSGEFDWGENFWPYLVEFQCDQNDINSSYFLWIILGIKTGSQIYVPVRSEVRVGDPRSEDMQLDSLDSSKIRWA